jgi:hypothetical protein
MSGEFEKDYALSAMPSGGVCMISKAVELETPLIYSLNKQWHYGDDPAKRPFKDYVTFVLMDDAFKYHDKYLLSMGISFENPDRDKDMYYLLALSRFDDIISQTLRSFANAMDIDVVNAIIAHRDFGK